MMAAQTGRGGLLLQGQQALPSRGGVASPSTFVTASPSLPPTSSMNGRARFQSSASTSSAAPGPGGVGRPALAHSPGLTAAVGGGASGTAEAFDSGRFSRWLRMLLVAFYTDEEVVVADLLLRRAALLSDTALAEVLGLPDQQVRKVLEQRLVPDCLVERRTEYAGKGRQEETPRATVARSATRSFYRISPAAVSVAARRLQMLEDTFSTIGEERYQCPKCHRSYDSLEAVSFTGRRKDSNNAPSCGGSSFAFLCQECDEELRLVSEHADSQRHRLQRFRSQCRDLLVLTREIADMPIPHFGREDPTSQAASSSARIAADTAPSAGGCSGGGGSSSSLAGLSTGAMATAKAATAAKAPGSSADSWIRHEEWFRTEVLGVEGHLCCVMPVVSPATWDEAAWADATQQTQASMYSERLLQRLVARAPEVRRRADEAVGGLRHASQSRPCGSVAAVQGDPYTLAHLLKDENLQDRMTDDEYERFYRLCREHLRSLWSGSNEPTVGADPRSEATLFLHPFASHSGGSLLEEGTTDMAVC